MYLVTPTSLQSPPAHYSSGLHGNLPLEDTVLGEAELDMQNDPGWKGEGGSPAVRKMRHMYMQKWGDEYLGWKGEGGSLTVRRVR